MSSASRMICGFEFADHLMDGLESDSNGSYATSPARPGSGPRSYRAGPGQFARFEAFEHLWGDSLFAVAVWLDALPASGTMDIAYIHGHGRPGYVPLWWATYHDFIDPMPYPYHDPAVYSHIATCQVSSDGRLISYNPNGDAFANYAARVPSMFMRSEPGVVPTGQWFIIYCLADVGAGGDRMIDPAYKFFIHGEDYSNEFGTDFGADHFASNSTCFVKLGSLAGHGGTVGLNLDDLNYLLPDGQGGLPDQESVPLGDWPGAWGCPHVHALKPVADVATGDWGASPLYPSLSPGGDYVSSSGGVGGDTGMAVALQTPVEASANTDSQVITGVLPIIAHSRAPGTAAEYVVARLQYGGFVEPPPPLLADYQADGDLSAGWPAGFRREVGQSRFASDVGKSDGRTQILFPGYPRTHRSTMTVQRDFAGTYAVGALGALIECWPALVPIVDPFPQHVSDAGDIAPAGGPLTTPVASFASASPRVLISLDPYLFIPNTPTWLRGQAWLEHLTDGRWHALGQIYVPAIAGFAIALTFEGDRAKCPAIGTVIQVTTDMPDTAPTIPLKIYNNNVTFLMEDAAIPLVPTTYKTAPQHLRIDAAWVPNPPPLPVGTGVPGQIAPVTVQRACVVLG